MPSTRATTKDPTTTGLITVSTHIASVSAELDSVLRGWAQPPEPDLPVALEATTNILAQAAHITTTANAILTKLRGG